MDYSKIKLLICTPTYEFKMYAPYVASLDMSMKLLDQLGVQHMWMPVCGDAYVDRVKNTIVHRFKESEFTDLMMIDSDLEWNFDAIASLLQVPYEVVGGDFRMKNNWEKYISRIYCHPDGTPIMDPAGTGLIKAEWLPGGFLRLKKSCVEKMYEAYYEEGYYDTLADPTNTNRYYSAIINCEIRNKQRWSEDTNFCRKWRAIGGEIWLDPNINFTHYGVQGFTGNFHQFLLKQPRDNQEINLIPKNNANPLVSVVIPCYNHGQYLGEAIESVFNQTHSNYEIIVVNDGSTDDSEMVARGYATSIKLINQHNKGLAAARNAGITAANGEWVICLDADDKLDPEYIKKCLKAGADIVGTGFQFFGDLLSQTVFKENPTYEDLLQQNQIHCSALFRKKIWEEIGGFDEAMGSGGYEDWDFWLRALKVGYKAKTIREPLLFYRKHGQSMINKANENAAEIVNYIMQKHNLSMVQEFRPVGGAV